MRLGLDEEGGVTAVKKVTSHFGWRLSQFQRDWLSVSNKETLWTARRPKTIVNKRG
jgi:hypothetical protein